VFGSEDNPCMGQKQGEGSVGKSARPEATEYQAGSEDGAADQKTYASHLRYDANRRAVMVGAGLGTLVSPFV